MRALPELPEEVWSVLDRSVTVEYTSLTRAGAPIMVPVTPYVSDDRTTLDVSTGLTYPTKAERARRNPKVSLLYSDPSGYGPGAATGGSGPGLGDRSRQRSASEHRPVRTAGDGEDPGGVPGTAEVPAAPLGLVFRPDLDPGDAHPGLVVGLEGPAHRPGSVGSPVGRPRSALGDPAPPGKPPAAWLEPPSDWRVIALDRATAPGPAEPGVGRCRWLPGQCSGRRAGPDRGRIPAAGRTMPSRHPSGSGLPHRPYPPGGVHRAGEPHIPRPDIRWPRRGVRLRRRARAGRLEHCRKQARALTSASSARAVGSVRVWRPRRLAVVSQSRAFTFPDGGSW